MLLRTLFSDNGGVQRVADNGPSCAGEATVYEGRFVWPPPGGPTEGFRAQDGTPAGAPSAGRVPTGERCAPSTLPSRPGNPRHTSHSFAASHKTLTGSRVGMNSWATYAWKPVLTISRMMGG